MKLIKFDIKIIFIFSLFTFNFLGAQELQSLISESLVNSPKIKKFELQYRIASEKFD